MDLSHFSPPGEPGGLVSDAPVASGDALYRSTRGDVVDLVCYDYYGRSNGTTEAVFEANRWLSSYGPFLPGDVYILLPKLDPMVR